MDQGERSISCSDYGNGAVLYGCAACVLYPGEIASTTERLQGLDDKRPGFDTICFHVDEEVQSLIAVAIENTVFCRTCWKRRDRVLLIQHVKDGVDIKGRKGARGGQSCGFMADVEGRVEEPDVSFDADAAGRESGIERDSPPVIIVRVDAFLYEREVSWHS